MIKKERNKRLRKRIKEKYSTATGLIVFPALLFFGYWLVIGNFIATTVFLVGILLGYWFTNEANEIKEMEKRLR